MEEGKGIEDRQWISMHHNHSCNLQEISFLYSTGKQYIIIVISTVHETRYRTRLGNDAHKSRENESKKERHQVKVKRMEII